MSFSKKIAPVFFTISIFCAQADFTDAKEQSEENTREIVVTVQEKEDGGNGKIEVYEATLKDLLRKEEDPLKAYEKYEFYGKRIIRLNGKITDEIADEVIAKMHILNELDHGKPIELHINSPGGLVYAGLRIFNAMKTIESETHTYCDGKAVSMAAVLTISGSERTAMPACRIMIHEVSGGTKGKSGDMEYQLHHAKSLENMIFQVISEHSGLSLEDVKEIGSVDFYYTSEQALELGFVDRIKENLHEPATVTGSRRIIPDLLRPEQQVSRMYHFDPSLTARFQ